ncbi:MAG: large conductance mechanosensitive channel protein MscL [Ruminococcus sp.]
MKKVFGEFKEFVMRGNVLDLAVAVIIGGAFQTIVSSLCDDVITPFIQLVISKCIGVDSIEEMTKVLNIGTIQLGNFISAIINFLIMAVIIFCLVKFINRVMTIGKKKEEEEEEVTTKTCPFCKSEIDIEATRCPHCTSVLEEE